MQLADPREKLSNWDGRPQSLAGHAADDAGYWTQRDLRPDPHSYPSPPVILICFGLKTSHKLSKTLQLPTSGCSCVFLTAAANPFLMALSNGKSTCDFGKKIVEEEVLHVYWEQSIPFVHLWRTLYVKFPRLLGKHQHQKNLYLHICTNLLSLNQKMHSRNLISFILIDSKLLPLLKKNLQDVPEHFFDFMKEPSLPVVFIC